MKAKIRGKLRSVSPAMARRLRAKGIRVEADAPRTPKPAPVKRLEEVLPPAPTPTPEPNPIDVLSDLMEQKLGKARDDVFDLSDEELERLTKPES